MESKPKKPDKCYLCCNAPAHWLVLDSKTHTYYELWLDRARKLVMKTTRQEDAYLVCRGCRKLIERFNRSSRKKRELRFERWPNG